MQLVNLKLINAAGSPVAYPGSPTLVGVPTISNVTQVWVGVSADGLSNQAYALTTPLATIQATYPRVYQGISADVLGDTNVYLNSLADYERRVNACCLRLGSEGSDSSPAASPEVPDGYQLRFTIVIGEEDLDDIVIWDFETFPGSTLGFADWGDGTGEQMYGNSENAIQMSHQYTAPGTYLVRARLVEPELLNTINLLYDYPNIPITAVQFDIPFVNLTALDFNSEQLTDFDVTNLPALDSLALGGANHLSSAVVDQLLADLDASGVNNGFVDVSSQAPSAPPGPIGLAAKASLEGKGWTVATD